MRDQHPLHALCPYFAMFPPEFARAQVARFTQPGDVVLDPFSGRGTTLLEASLWNRRTLAADINPVATCVTGAKARVPNLAAVNSRLDSLRDDFKSVPREEIDAERESLPPFFKKAFHYWTLREVLFLRQHLDWQADDTDRFIAALALGSLHGEMDHSKSYFSNQMPRTISTKPDYSLRYWQRHGLKAERKRVFDLIGKRAQLRLGKGLPPQQGVAVRSDVRSLGRVLLPWEQSVRLVVTSPPYLDVTNFEEDQWLRLWFLGGDPEPTRRRISKDDRHSNANRYWRFIADAWKGIANLLAPDATVVCRISGRGQTVESLARGMMGTMRAAFPDAWMLHEPRRSVPRRRQTDNFRPGTKGIGGEVDFAFRVG